MKKSTLIRLLGVLMCVCLLASFAAGCSGDSGDTAATPTPAPATAAPTAAATKTPATAAPSGDKTPEATPVPEYVSFEDVYIEDEHNIADQYGEIWSTSNRTATMSSSQYSDPGLKNLGCVSNPDGTFDLPFCEEGSSIEIWITLGSHNTAVTNMDEVEGFQYIQQLTGLDTVFVHPTYGQEATEFGLMVASGDWPDIARYDFDENKGEAYVIDGIYYDMQYMVRDWMPNYRYRIRATGMERDAGSDSGKIWRMYYLEDPQELPWQGLLTRTDLMNQAGITEYPATLDEWEALFATEQAFFGEGYATMIPGNTALSPNSEWVSAWDIGIDFYADASGVIKYGPLQDEFKEYLERMKDWYDKGYIYKEFTTIGRLTEEQLNEGIISTQTGAFGGARASYLNRYANLPADFWLEPVVAPTMNKGDVQHFRRVSTPLYNCSVVMGDTKNPVLVAKYYDWLYTDDGAMIATYGEYGKCWVYNSDGMPDGTDYVRTAPEGVDFSIWRYRVNCGWMYIGVLLNDWWILPNGQNWVRGSTDMSWYFAGEVWALAAGDYVYPRFATLTGEESTEYANLYSDIQTYLQETVPQFIVGILDIDSEFDVFRDTLKTMGVERCVEMKQASYDRYWAR